MNAELLNTLFVMTQGAYVRLDGETVKVEAEGSRLTQTPLLHLGGIVLFGQVGVSPYLVQRCAEDGRSITYLDMNGRYLARMVGATSGNVLLRKAHYEAFSSPARTLTIARQFVAGKLQNSRAVLRRALREGGAGDSSPVLQASIAQMENLLRELGLAASLETLRGIEGHGASAYFDAFDVMITQQRTHFRFAGRSRRPPRDRMNCLLSFLYALASTDCRTALEGVGLDPQFGFLHSIRSGRPALCLDLVEEFRAPLADRLALSLVNLKQIDVDDFQERPGPSFLLTDEGRKKVIVAYQKRKQREISHPLLKKKVPLGLVPHLQARILARHLRGEIPSYAPFIPG